MKKFEKLFEERAMTNLINMEELKMGEKRRKKMPLALDNTKNMEDIKESFDNEENMEELEEDE